MTTHDEIYLRMLILLTLPIAVAALVLVAAVVAAAAVAVAAAAAAVGCRGGTIVARKQALPPATMSALPTPL